MAAVMARDVAIWGAVGPDFDADVAAVVTPWGFP